MKSGRNGCADTAGLSMRKAECGKPKGPGGAPRRRCHALRDNARLVPLAGQNDVGAAALQKPLGRLADHRPERPTKRERLGRAAEIDHRTGDRMQIQAINPTLRLSLRLDPTRLGTIRCFHEKPAGRESKRAPRPADPTLSRLSLFRLR